MTEFPQLVLGFEAIGLEGHGTPFGVVVDIDEEGLKVGTKSTAWLRLIAHSRCPN